MISRNQILWFVWIVLSLVGAVILSGFIFLGGPRHMLLIGQTTAAHGQIELACESCHTTSLFENLTKNPKKLAAEMTKACGTCHLEELNASNDSHPTKKFRGAKKAKTRAQLNAFYCQTCHAEHVPEITRPMAVSLPEDLCVACHTKIGEERESHVGLEFTTCASAGCHNFHDNTALYESFLVKHGAGEDFLAHAVQEFAAISRTPSIVRAALKDDNPVDALETYLRDAALKTDNEDEKEAIDLGAKAEALLDKVLHAEDAIAPETYLDDDAIAAWAGSAHAEAGLNCASCHAPDHVEAGQAESLDMAVLTDNWIEKPQMGVCADCHENQARTFTMGKHGMRFHPDVAKPREVEADGPMSTIVSVAANYFQDKPLGPITVGETQRAPLMKPESHDLEIGNCNSCHLPHEVDLEVAAVDSCVACHNDDHTQNYFDSQHHELWQMELAGEGAPGTGVSCADCHMPKIEAADGFFTSHNQNDFLRPNEKMIRPVCMSCHGLAFSIDALADPELVESNFNGRPSKHIESIDWALKREE